MSLLREFDALLRTDPLFAAEGLDLDRASQALNSLESAVSDIESVFSKDSWRRRLFLTRYPLARYAVPIPFLRAFIESERLRRMFLSAPTEENARRVLAGWRVAARAYMKSVERYTRLHEVLYSLEKQPDSFVLNDMVGNQTTLADIDRARALMAQNAELLNRTVREREHALRVGGSFERRTASFSPLPGFQKGELSPTHASLHALEMQQLLLMGVEILETHGPLQYELSHFDDVPTKHLFMLYVLRNPTINLPTARVVLADRFYFLPIIGPNARFGGIGKSGFELLIKRGMRYWYQSATNLYTSRDLNYWSEVLTIVDRTRRPQLDWHLVEAQRSSLFDLLLGACANDIQIYVWNTYERIALGKSAGFSLLYGLLVRSYPSIYYLPFNQSVWRLKELPNFLGSARISKNDQLYRTEDAIAADTTPEEMELIMQGIRIRKEAREEEGLTPPIGKASPPQAIL